MYLLSLTLNEYTLYLSWQQREKKKRKNRKTPFLDTFTREGSEVEMSRMLSSLVCDVSLLSSLSECTKGRSGGYYETEASPDMLF